MPLPVPRPGLVVSEVNRFVRPGPDLRPVPRDQPGRFDYGMLPPALYREIATKLTELARRRSAAVVHRDG